MIDNSSKSAFKLFITLIVIFVLSVNNSFAIDGKKVITYTVEDGLPRDIVTCFIQDSIGYSWVGTSNGLSRFNGTDFLSNEQLEGFFINSIAIDGKNNLWVSVNHGLFLYDYEHDKFMLIHKGYTHKLTIHNDTIYYLLGKTLYKLEGVTPVKVTIKDVNVTSYAVTEEGIWYGSQGKGIRLLGTDKGYLKTRHFNIITEIDSVIFGACYNGDLFIKKKNEPLTKIDVNNDNVIKDIKKVNNQIWLATSGGGIIILDKNYKQVDHIYVNNEEVPLRSNTINKIYANNKLIWVSTYGGGLTCILPDSELFEKISPIENKAYNYRGSGIYQDGDKYYLGTDYSLSIFDDEGQILGGLDKLRLSSDLNGTNVKSITKDYKGDFIVATYDGLLGKYNDKWKLLNTYKPFRNEVSGLDKGQHIVQLFDVNSKEFIITSLGSDNNIVLFNSETGVIKDVECGLPGSLIQAMSIRRNRAGEILVLINRHGLYRYSYEDNRLYNMMQNARLNLVLNDFYQDIEGNYFISTKMNGLLKVSPEGKVLKNWTRESGLKTNTAFRLESSNDSLLWISTISGLAMLDMTKDKLQVFDTRHGLSSNEFSLRSSLVLKDNRIIFGNTNGFTIVDPSKLVVDTSRPKVVISDITFHNKSIRELSDYTLSRPLEEKSKISLPNSRNSFTISFFANDYNLPKYNTFAYKLEGLEDDWIYLGENNYTTYTNLYPGEYTFKVKATNKSNVWNNIPTELIIEILPPWYGTWWAYFIYVIISFVIIAFLLKIYNKRLNLKLDLDMANFAVEKEHELTEKKMTFFTSISHDLKTIATLIAAPVNDLLSMDDLGKDKIKKLNVIKRNAEMLYKLNVELLEFRKISKNKLLLKVQKVDVESIINNVYESFTQECSSKNIEYTIDVNLKEYTGGIYLDVKKVERILLNLLSNAIKYTNEGGTVSIKVQASQNKGILDIIVRDTGIGFDTYEADKIFDRFYQVEDNSKQYGGVGIGLFIVRELANLHHGAILVKSEIGKGSTFTVTLPISKENYTVAEISNEEWVNVSSVEDEKSNINDIVKGSIVDIPKRKYNQYSIVIVEDNEDLRSYLEDHFSENNTVSVAENGKEGYDLIIDKSPDIIISDVDMPVMNGYEMCDLVKKDFNTSHIPFILLTGNSELEDKLKGMYHGADNYITKPFEISYIDAVVDSLLNNRHKLREKFMGIEPVTDEEQMSSHDIEFINKFKQLIIDNISNPELNIDTLISHFSVSRSQLNRKVKDLVGTTPSNYIKTIRLKQAYELLMVKNSRVSDVAYKTGFSDPNYFTLCFKKEFGKNPSKV